MTKIVPVILAGGAGTRLWPVSRDALPKQFLPLVGERSTYQDTLLRVAAGSLFAPPIVITGADFRFFARRQAEDIGIEPIVMIEPMRRDSGPAVAAAAVLARNRDADAVVLALAADHVILDAEEFRTTCAAALGAAEAGRILTFGIAPTAPKTSYGYIRRGKPAGAEGVFMVEAFVEKPDAETAARYVAEGYLWNSGNFLFRAEVLLAELNRYEPAMVTAVERAVATASNDLGFVRLAPEAFSSAPQKSIDYAVMEKTDRAAVIVGNFRWSDIGSWDAIFDIAERDKSGNAIHGAVIMEDARNCVIHSVGRLTAVLGADDLVVVSTPDAVLVMPRARAQEVRELVGKLKNAQRPEATVHRSVHRPWGYYDSIDRGERFQVKRIVVQPNGTLSLQKHHHRAEHWVVVRGTAEVTIGSDVRFVHENESVYIPIGTVHRLANRGKIPLELIEVQTGSYLGEDDIVRIDDIYKRS
jgi:mannose-1-phosphate guanylyltransferase/mannose-6-phosphate isomerase